MSSAAHEIHAPPRTCAEQQPPPNATRFVAMSLNHLDACIDHPTSDPARFDSSPAISYLTSRCGDRSLAEDITQDALLTILTREDLRHEWTSLHLLFRVALNELNNQRRKSRGRAAYMMPLSVRDLLNCTDRHNNYDLAIDVRDALARLGKSERDLILRYWDGFTYEEMADEYGISEGALRMRLMRAKDRFSREMDGYRGRGGKEIRE